MNHVSAGWLPRFDTWLNARPWLNATYLALAVGGWVTAVVLFFRGKRERQLVYRTAAFPLVRGKLTEIPGVRIEYEGQPIDNMSLTRIALWNRGREPVEPKDIPTAEPIRFVVQPPAKLLGARLVHESNPANKFTVAAQRHRSEVVVGFEFIQQDDGLIAEVYHTGTSTNDVFVAGAVKGAPPLAAFDPARLVSAPIIEFTNRVLTPFELKGHNAVVRAVTTLVVFPLAMLLVCILIPFLAVDQVLSPFRRAPKVFLIEGPRRRS